MFAEGREVGGGRANTVENTRLGRMLLSLSCFVNRWSCNCTLDLYSSQRSPASVTIGNLKKSWLSGSEACALKWQHIPPVDVNCFCDKVQTNHEYPQFLLFDQVWKWEKEISSSFCFNRATEHFKVFITRWKSETVNFIKFHWRVRVRERPKSKQFFWLYQHCEYKRLRDTFTLLTNCVSVQVTMSLFKL